jgi:hypothetical protein
VAKHIVRTAPTGDSKVFVVATGWPDALKF